jgi:hypothetical protein
VVKASLHNNNSNNNNNPSNRRPSLELLVEVVVGFLEALGQVNHKRLLNLRPRVSETFIVNKL